MLYHLLGFILFSNHFSSFPSHVDKIFSSYFSYLVSFSAIYLLVVLSICVLSIFETAYVLCCHNYARDKPVPYWVTKVTEGFMMPLMCKNGKNCSSFCCCQRRCKTDTITDDGLQMEKKIQFADDETQRKEMGYRMTWIKVAQCIDGFCFSSSMFTTVILTLSMYLLLMYGYCKE